MTQPDVPAPMAELAQLMSECVGTGDFAGAARHASELLGFARAALGERDPNVLALKVSLATLRLQAGDSAVAYAEFEQALPDLIEVLGRQHVSTLTARHCLADRPQQDPVSSLTEWLQLFADEQQALGAEHESTLAAREKIAEKRWDIGDLVGAMAEGEQVLAARRRTLGDDHADTLGMRLMLAIWRGRAGDVVGAVSELEPLLEELREKLGQDHAHALSARHMLTLWAPDRAGVTDEVAAWEALVDDETRVLGTEHPITVAARQELASHRAECDAAGDESSAQKSLDWWLDWINVLIDMARDTYLAEMELDYSETSLEAVEDAVRHRYRDPTQPLSDDHFVAGVVAYLGETLLRVAGGAWEWTADATEASFDCLLRDPGLLLSAATHRWHVMSNDEPDAVGLPIVRPDPGTGLPEVSPVHLLLDALESADGGVWVSTYQRWRRAVGERAAAEPGWSPTKQHTLADGFSSPPPSAVLDKWLIRQHRGFPEWAARYGGDWDYTPESVDRLTALVGRITPTSADFQDPAHADFVDGASYYLGEMLRRGYPSRWVYREFRDEGDPITANFELQLADNSGFTSPYLLLRGMLERGDPGATRAYYDQWVG
jgi:hypothetical protein